MGITFFSHDPMIKREAGAWMYRKNFFYFFFFIRIHPFSREEAARGIPVRFSEVLRSESRKREESLPNPLKEASRIYLYTRRPAQHTHTVALLSSSVYIRWREREREWKSIFKKIYKSLGEERDPYGPFGPTSTSWLQSGCISHLETEETWESEREPSQSSSSVSFQFAFCLRRCGVVIIYNLLLLLDASPNFSPCGGGGSDGGEEGARGRAKISSLARPIPWRPPFWIAYKFREEEEAGLGMRSLFTCII